MGKDTLRSGDLVEVKSAAEILATLDDTSSLEGLPFMPEMLKHCGRRFTVDKRAAKICDTVHSTSSRRIPQTVLLEQLRCDGSGHDGCDAECRLFWKESWLRRVEPGDPAPPPPSPDESATAAAAIRLRQSAKRTEEVEGRPLELYRCQATDLYRASHHLRTLDPRPYVREYTSGNVPLGRFLKVVARAAVHEPLRKVGIRPDGPLPGTKSAPKEPPLNLQPGEWVQIKSKEEILATLNEKGKNRGLWFDVEMVPFCGGTFRVRKRVNRLVDDRNGRMINIKSTSDCIMLDDVVCSGDLSAGRWFCPRAIYPYWRECWLRRAPAPPAAHRGASGAGHP